ncbi:molybdenum cofactor guanylyltransferase MobA [Pseudomonadota bacterium]
MSIKQVTGIVLAGGRARRMGGIDKGLIDLDGMPMIAHVVRRLMPQVSGIIISANRNLTEYGEWTDRVVKDTIGDFDGPLAGMASGLDLVNTEFAATVPCDSPLLTKDLISRMYRECVSRAADIAVAHDGERLQPVFTMMRPSLGASILGFLESGERKIDKWFEQHAFISVDFSDRPESFLNINTEDDKRRLLALGRLYK